jgi:hypothetical protein
VTSRKIGLSRILRHAKHDFISMGQRWGNRAVEHIRFAFIHLHFGKKV